MKIDTRATYSCRIMNYGTTARLHFLLLGTSAMLRISFRILSENWHTIFSEKSEKLVSSGVESVCQPLRMSFLITLTKFEILYSRLDL